MTNLSSRLKSHGIHLKFEGVIVAFLVVLCLSCSQQSLYEQYQVVDQRTWEKNKTYYFSFNVNDTATLYNLTFEVRNNNMYPYQNLWLFTGEERPIGPLISDTIECILADEYGKWSGHGISLFQSEFPIRTNYQFKHSGVYTFSFRQGMRDSTLTGIEEIGFRVEKANKD